MNLVAQRALLLLPSLATAYPPPEPCSGWCYQNIRDPNVVLKDGTYYRFATHDNFSMATAPSIAGPWIKRGSVLDNGTTISMPLLEPKDAAEGDNHHSPADGGPALWAPDVSLIGETFYLTYTVTRGGKTNEIGVATSQTLEPGSWTDHGSIGLPSNEYSNRIDSNLFQASAGSTPLLAFGSYSRGLYQIPLTLPPMKTNGQAVEVAHNKSSDAIEAAYQFRWTVSGKQWYYLFFSSGRCCNKPTALPKAGDEYKIMVCRSDSPTGPFADDLNQPCMDSGGKMVLGTHGDVYGPGGQGVLYDEQLGTPVIYYHYMNRSTGYNVENVYFGWNKLDFDSGWPTLVGDTDGGGGDEGCDGETSTDSTEDGQPAPTPRASTSAAMRLDAPPSTSVAFICTFLLGVMVARYDVLGYAGGWKLICIRRWR